MSDVADYITQKEAEIKLHEEKIKKLRDAIKAKKKKESIAERKKRTRNLIQFGAIITKKIGIDPLSDEDLSIFNKFIEDYISFYRAKLYKDEIYIFTDPVANIYAELKNAINTGTEGSLFYLGRDGLKRIREEYHAKKNR